MYQSLRSEEFTANNVTDVKPALLTIETNRYGMLIVRLQVIERRLSIATSSTITIGEVRHTSINYTDKIIELLRKKFRWLLTGSGEL